MFAWEETGNVVEDGKGDGLGDMMAWDGNGDGVGEIEREMVRRLVKGMVREKINLKRGAFLLAGSCDRYIIENQRIRRRKLKRSNLAEGYF